MDRWPETIDPPTSLSGKVEENTLETPYGGGYAASRPGGPRDPYLFTLDWELLPVDQFGILEEFLSDQRFSAYPFEWPYPIGVFGFAGYVDPAYGESGFGEEGFGEGPIYVVRMVKGSFQWVRTLAAFYDRVSLQLKEM